VFGFALLEKTKRKIKKGRKTMTHLSTEQQEIMEREVNPTVETATALVVKSPETSLQAQEFLKHIKTTAKRVYEKFHPPVEAAHAAWKAAKDLENFFMTPFEEAERIIKRKVVAFQQEIEQRQREEAARIEAQRAQEERLRKEELQRQADAAAAKGKAEKAEALRAKAEEYVAPPVFVPPVVSQASGTAFKKTWKAEVTDLPAFLKAVAEGRAPLGVISINESALNAYAKGVKGTMAVPGLRFFEATSLAVSTK
jgi:phage-related minor tail protein